MLVSDMLSEIRDHGFDDLTDTRILSFLNDTYYDICSREPWPFLEQSATVVVDANGVVTSPTDIRAVLSLYDTTGGRPLTPFRLDAFRDTYGGNLTQTGDPFAYYFIGNSLRIYPVGTSHTLQLGYIRQPPALTVSPDSSPILPTQHHRAVVLGSLVKCYMMEDDFENSAMFTNAYEKRVSDMRNELWNRQFDRPDTILDVDEVSDVDLLY